MGRRLFFIPFLFFLIVWPFVLSLGQTDSLNINLLNAEGIGYARNGDFYAAEKSFLSILEIDSNDVAARNNLSNVYRYLGRSDDALKILQDLKRIIIRICGLDCMELAKVYMNIAIIYKQKQDYELALQYLSYSERIIHINSDRSSMASSIYINLGNIYFGTQEWRKALEVFQKSLDVKKTYGHLGLDKSYANIASVYENLNILDSAEIFYNLAIEDKIENSGLRSHNLISVYLNYGALLQKKKDSVKAYKYFTEALDIAKETYSRKNPVISACYNSLGSWYLFNGETDIAIANFHQAILSVVLDFDDEDPFAIPPIETGILSYPVLLNSLSLKANAITVLYKENLNVKTLEVALETQEIANLLTEKMRSMFLGQESKLLITETSRNGYDQAIRIAYDLYMLTDEPFYANKAFMSAEKGKSSVLLASLQEVENKNNLGIPQDLQDKEQLVKNKSEFYKKLLYEEKQRPMPDSTQIGVWQGNLLAISQEHDSITSIINTRFPEYASKYDNDVIDLEGIQNGLRDNQVLMEYSITDTSLFIFAIEKRAFSIKRIPIDSTFYRNIDILSKFLRNNEFANNTFSDYTNYTESAYRLYETLVLPVEPQIEGKALIIIPDGELGYLPFECLLTSKDGADKMDYRKLPYLIFNFKTSYSYSATLLFTENDKKHPSNRRVIAFAPTYENISNISSSKFPANRDYSSYLVPLKFITEEIKNISAIIDCDKYEGFEATEANFKENAHHYDILHLAMHTLINDENPMYSKLVFTLNNDTIEENDGLLNTYEIFNMEFLD